MPRYDDDIDDSELTAEAVELEALQAKSDEVLARRQSDLDAIALKTPDSMALYLAVRLQMTDVIIEGLEMTSHLSEFGGVALAAILSHRETMENTLHWFTTRGNLEAGGADTSAAAMAVPEDITSEDANPLSGYMASMMAER